jgi:phytoene synthase
VLLARSVAGLTLARGPTGIEPLPEASYLIAAVAAAARPHEPAARTLHRAAWQRFDDRAAWVIDLFERLERRDQAERWSGRAQYVGD